MIASRVYDLWSYGERFVFFSPAFGANPLSPELLRNEGAAVSIGVVRPAAKRGHGPIDTDVSSFQFERKKGDGFKQRKKTFSPLLLVKSSGVSLQITANLLTKSCQFVQVLISSGFVNILCGGSFRSSTSLVSAKISAGLKLADTRCCFVRFLRLRFMASSNKKAPRRVLLCEARRRVSEILADGETGGPR